MRYDVVLYYIYWVLSFEYRLLLLLLVSDLRGEVRGEERNEKQD